MKCEIEKCSHEKSKMNERYKELKLIVHNHKIKVEKEIWPVKISWDVKRCVLGDIFKFKISNQTSYRTSIFSDELDTPHIRISTLIENTGVILATITFAFHNQRRVS